MFAVRRAARLSTLTRAVQKQPLRFASDDKNMYNTPWGRMIEHPVNAMGKIPNNHPSEAKDIFRGGNRPDKTYGPLGVFLFTAILSATTYTVIQALGYNFGTQSTLMEIDVNKKTLQSVDFAVPGYHEYLAGIGPKPLYVLRGPKSSE